MYYYVYIFNVTPRLGVIHSHIVWNDNNAYNYASFIIKSLVSPKIVNIYAKN